MAKNQGDNVILPSLDIFYIVISAITFAVYSILIKRIAQNALLIVLFWINFFTYLGFFAIYLVRKFILDHDVFFIEQLIHEYTFVNAPLYLLMAVSFLGSFLIFNLLISEYEVSKVIPFAQMSLLFTMIGYLLLGDPFDWSAVIGVILVCIGAMVSAFDRFHWPNIFKPLAKIPKALWIGVLCEALLMTLNQLITFLLTQRTTVDKAILDGLKHVFPFSFHNPFYFNLGARFFISIIFLFYLLNSKKYKGKVLSTLQDHFWEIMLISIIYLTSAYTYQDAYRLTTDKNVLNAMSKISVPTVLLLGAFLFNEKLTIPKMVGSIIILIGGALALFL